MTEMRPPFAPFALYATAMRAYLDTLGNAQDALVETMDRAAHPTSQPIDWITVQVPVPNHAFFLDQEQMRDAFHRLADANLRSWELTANALQAMPNWVFWPTRMPGSVMTDFFDRIRRVGSAVPPANDAMTAETGPTARTTRPGSGVKAVPRLLNAPDGEPDDLTKIKGIGAKLQERLNALGIYHYAQIAEWSTQDGAWIDDQLAFKGRVAREDWIAQAKALAAQQAA